MTPICAWLVDSALHPLLLLLLCCCVAGVCFCDAWLPQELDINVIGIKTSNMLGFFGLTHRQLLTKAVGALHP